MDGPAVMRVTLVVVALMQLLKWAGVSPRWAPLVVALLSALTVGLWALGQPPTSLETAFNYFAMWVTGATSAAAVGGLSWTVGPARRARASHRRRARHSTGDL